MRDKLSCLLLVLTISVSALAQQSSGTVEFQPDAGRLRAHVTYLASEPLEGRRTGTKGAELAAQYIDKEFARYGLKRSGDSFKAVGKNLTARAEGYLQSFPYVAGVELGKNNSLHLTTRGAGGSEATNARPATLDLRLKEDWMPLSWSANGGLENVPVAFAGYGLTASNLHYDDYAGVEVKDRIVIALAGTPDGDPHGPFAHFGELRLRAATARDRGAKALLVIAREEDFQSNTLAQMRYDNAGGDAGLPVAGISRASARRILEAGGITLSVDDLEKAWRARQASTGSVKEASAAPPPDAHSSASTLARQNLSTALTNVTLSINTEIVRRTAPAYNVVGVLEGTDPQVKNEIIVIGAHYDHLGRGGAGSLAPREGEIHFGADDNASGTAALLELARLFAQVERTKLRRTLVFIAFGGEEEGLLGSNFYVNNATVPMSQTVAMINMDMIGRLKDNKLFISGVGTAQEWKLWIAKANQEELRFKVTEGASGVKVSTPPAGDHGGMVQGERPLVIGAHGPGMATAAPGQRFALALNEDGFGPSDHSSFYAKKVPVLFFFTGAHEDYHKPTDTAERLNYDGEARIVSFIRDILRAVNESPQRPTYAVAKSAGLKAGASGFRVTLGTVPSYAEGSDGVKLDAVRDASPAVKAGLKAGDVIVKIAGRDVRNVYDYTYALAEMKAGQEYEVEVMRDGQRLQLKITPAARQ